MQTFTFQFNTSIEHIQALTKEEAVRKAVKLQKKKYPNCHICYLGK